MSSDSWETVYLLKLGTECLTAIAWLRYRNSYYEDKTVSRPSYLHNRNHSVESPSMVDPQWIIWYWRSKWNLHTVYWDAVGCEWGTTSVYFGITYVCLIPSILPVFAAEPQYRHQYIFVFVKSIIWRTHTKSSKNFMLVKNLNGVCRTNIE